MFQEPPISPDDTQPTASHHRPTEPHRQNRRTILPSWLLLALMLISLTSLIGLILFLNASKHQITTTTTSKNITLIVSGTAQNIVTYAETVNDVLREQNLQVGENDALSVAPETLLYDAMIITINRARSVTLIIEDDTQLIETPFTNPQDILDSLAITLNSADKIWLDGTLADHSALATWVIPVNEMVIDRGATVTILDGDSTTEFDTTANTIGDALFEAGVAVYLTDAVTPDVSTPLLENTTIVIERARPVTIQVDGINIETRVQGQSVLDALTESGIVLVGLDYTIPAETEIITGGMTIYVLRVTESIVSTEESIPYETTMQADANLDLDARQTIQQGLSGLRRINERVRYENGIEVGREPAGSEVVQAPQTEIIAYGTNIVIRTVDTPEGAREYWRRLRVYATSYHPEALGGDNVTAIGATLQHGVIGANPRIIPYRTNMYVPGYGIGMMADTGGSRSSPYWIDLGYSDEDYVGWHHYVDVYLLTPVPENVNYLLPAWQPMRGIPDN